MPDRPPVSQALLDLYDRYAHGLISRREFFDRAARFAVGGLTLNAVLESVLPRYAEAQQVRENDARLTGERIERYSYIWKLRFAIAPPRRRGLPPRRYGVVKASRTPDGQMAGLWRP